MFVVTVTYGTMADQLYASGIASRHDAEKLKAAALERGYLDAKIVPEKEYRAQRESRFNASATRDQAVARKSA